MFTFITNLWAIATKAPQIIGIIAAIMNVLGSTQVQKILEAVREAMQAESQTTTPIQSDEPARERFVTRVLRRLAFRTLGISQEQYVAMCEKYRNSAEIA